MKITGTFTVSMTPISTNHQPEDGNNLGRMALDKVYSDPLKGTGKGTVLTALTATKGSAGYVALEHVAGTLDGKTGSFILQHYGLMSAAGQHLKVEVVPDSGTGELTGLRGSLHIRQEDGVHHYDFSFEFG